MKRMMIRMGMWPYCMGAALITFADSRAAWKLFSDKKPEEGWIGS